MSAPTSNFTNCERLDCNQRSPSQYVGLFLNHSEINNITGNGKPSMGCLQSLPFKVGTPPSPKLSEIRLPHFSGKTNFRCRAFAVYLGGGFLCFILFLKTNGQRHLGSETWPNFGSVLFELKTKIKMSVTILTFNVSETLTSIQKTKLNILALFLLVRSSTRQKALCSHQLFRRKHCVFI